MRAIPDIFYNASPRSVPPFFDRGGAVREQDGAPSCRSRQTDSRATPAIGSATTGLRPLLTVWIGWLVVMAGVNLATPLTRSTPPTSDSRASFSRRSSPSTRSGWCCRCRFSAGSPIVSADGRWSSAGWQPAAPTHSLLFLVAGAVAAGAGHGFGFLNAQDELNPIAPPSGEARW